MRPIVLTILDGWGYSKEKVGNAIFNATKPNLSAIEKNYPSLLLQASGWAVGMSWGEAGNSEVGHLTLGAGRTIFQYLTRINQDIESGYFFQNQDLFKAITHAKSNNSTIHLAGLLGSGSVHSYFNHILGLLELMKRNNINDYKLHFFTDGKDSQVQGAISFLKKLDEYVPGSVSNLATVVGRDFAMDRAGQWELTRKAYEMLTSGKGTSTKDIYKQLENYYAQGFSDATIPPTIVNPEGIIRDGDSIIFFNFREDSMRQIVRTFVDSYFDIFPKNRIDNLFILGFTPFIESMDLHIVYPAPLVINSLAEFLSINSKKQFHIGETEKYAHITYFFNCLRNKPFDGETDVFIKSDPDPISTPKMQAGAIVDKVIEQLDRDYYDFFVINIANSDVLAHLGNLESTIAGIESVDYEIGRLSEKILSKDGILLITSDHGNAERVVYKSSGNVETKHDQNPVPLYVVAKEFQKNRSQEEITESVKEAAGILSDIAPTILELMQLPIPAEMTGDSLLRLLK